MKIRFVVILISILLTPTISFANIPTFDFGAIFPNFAEQYQTVMGKIENSKQVITLQQTMAKIGSAKSSISDFINSAKENILNNELIEKARMYKEQVEEYKAKYEALRAEAEAYLGGEDSDDGDTEGDDGDSEGDEGDTGDGTDGSGDGADGSGDGAGGSGDGAGGSGDGAGGSGTTAGGSGTTAGGSGTTAGGSGTTAGGSGTTAGGSGTTAGGSGDGAGGSGDGADGSGDGAGGSGTTARGSGTTARGSGTTADGNRNGDNESPFGLSASGGRVVSGASRVGTTGKPGLRASGGRVVSGASRVGTAGKPSLSASGGGVVTSGSRTTSLGKASPTANTSRLSSSGQPSLGTGNVSGGLSNSRSATSDSRIRTDGKSSLGASSDKGINDVRSKESLSNKSAELGSKSAEGSIDKNTSRDTKPRDEKGLVDAPTVETARKSGGFSAQKEVSDKETSSSLDKSSPAAASSRADSRNQSALTTGKSKGNISSSKDVTSGSRVSTVGKSSLGSGSDKNAVSKAKATSLDKSSSTSSSNISGTKDESIKENQPNRQKFKSSYGYGRSLSVYPLSFAFLGGSSDDIKTGETEEGFMIVPDSISLACNIGYEDAIKDKNMDKCLGDLFAKAFDSSLSTNERNSALKNFNNGYVEFLATTYFEALNMYNETMAFKNDEISPVITTQSTDIDASWRLAKEMHIVLAKSVNRLHKLWSRVLAMKMLAQYKEKQFVNKKDEE